MKPEDLARRLRGSRAGQAAGQAHAAADRVYQSLVRPDRPLGPESHKKPWLAAFLSLVVVGAGQLYNRQLLKAVFLCLLFYAVGLLLLAAYLVLGLWEAAQNVRADLAYVFLFVWCGLWLFAVFDAGRTAWLLKTGKRVIRFGFLRQGLFSAVSFIPIAGTLAPTEIVAPEDMNRQVGEVAADLAREHVFRWVVIRVLRFACLGIGVLLVALGMVVQVHILLTLGGLMILAGIVLFVI